MLPSPDAGTGYGLIGILVIILIIVLILYFVRRVLARDDRRLVREPQAGGCILTVVNLMLELARAVGEEHVLADPDLRALRTRLDRPFRRPGATSSVRRTPRRSRGAARVRGRRRRCPPRRQHRPRRRRRSARRRGAGLLAPLSDIGPVDARPGTSWSGRRDAARRAGGRGGRAGVRLDLGARDSATVGGMIATDAGGARALPTGRCARRSRPRGGAGRRPRDPPPRGPAEGQRGLLLAALLFGSEGTLGVITAVLVRLVPRVPHACRAVRGRGSRRRDGLGRRCAGRASLVRRGLLPRRGPQLVERVLDDVRLPLRRRAPCYVSSSARRRPTRRRSSPRPPRRRSTVVDQAAAEDTAGPRGSGAARGAARGGRPRGMPAEGRRRRPGGSVSRFAGACRRVAAPHRARAVLWGTSATATSTSTSSAPDRRDRGGRGGVLRLVAELGGTISAEHGVGVSKAKHLGLVRSSEDMDLLRTLKRGEEELDPGEIDDERAGRSLGSRPRSPRECRRGGQVDIAADREPGGVSVNAASPLQREHGHAAQRQDDAPRHLLCEWPAGDVNDEPKMAEAGPRPCGSARSLARATSDLGHASHARGVEPPHGPGGL